jgi:hypothetical protein
MSASEEEIQTPSTTTQNEQPSESTPKEPTIVFLFDMKNWYENISPLSKLDIFDIAPQVCTQFYLDMNIKTYVFILTKTTWDALSLDVRRKFMIISRRIKEEMEGPMTTTQREIYEQSDIFEFMMAQVQSQNQQQLDAAPESNLDTITEEEA